MNKKNKKRLLKAIITGSILGLFCIVGIGLRLGFEGNTIFLASAWFNRLIMGFVVGLSGSIIISKKYNTLIRGAFIGLIISFSWYLSTSFRDTIGFTAGIMYGIIIDYFATKHEKK